MHVGSHYKLWEFISWTRRDLYRLVPIAAAPTVLYQVFDVKLALPWVGTAVVGTAAAFIVGFRNTQTYNRLWEARQIWGAIVNTSRSLAMLTKGFVAADRETHLRIVRRHVAWLTALRHQLRKPQPWESSAKQHNVDYRARFSVPEWETTLEQDLERSLTPDELAYVLAKKNRATQLLALQSGEFVALHGQGRIGDLQLIELERCLVNLYDQQGKCERIKNFPYPRQFSSITLFFIWLLAIMLPFALLPEFAKFGPHHVWLTIPMSVVLGWVFTSMDRVGEATENPFEGGANDIPMASMSRSIEIDLLDMFDVAELPAPMVARNSIIL